jgi:copper homeostasis protein
VTLREICVDHVSAAIEAWSGGVDRIEYCARLDQDGLTPDLDELREVTDRVSIPVFAMVRPRPGNFVPAPTEIDEMLSTIDAVRDAGAAGIVLGVLTSAGAVDASNLTRLVQAANDLPVTFHRAFDNIANPHESLELLIEAGVQRLLTSGAGASAWEGRELLRELILRAGDRLVVMPGGGVRTDHVRELMAFTGAREIHSSTLLDL